MCLVLGLVLVLLCYTPGLIRVEIIVCLGHRQRVLLYRREVTRWGGSNAKSANRSTLRERHFGGRASIGQHLLLLHLRFTRCLKVVKKGPPLQVSKNPPVWLVAESLRHRQKALDSGRSGRLPIAEAIYRNDITQQQCSFTVTTHTFHVHKPAKLKAQSRSAENSKEQIERKTNDRHLDTGECVSECVSASAIE